MAAVAGVRAAEEAKEGVAPEVAVPEEAVPEVAVDQAAAKQAAVQAMGFRLPREGARQTVRRPRRRRR